MTLWEHVALILGGVAAVTVGTLDLFRGQHLGAAGDTALILGGLGVLGVKGVGVLPS